VKGERGRGWRTGTGGRNDTNNVCTCESMNNLKNSNRNHKLEEIVPLPYSFHHFFLLVLGFGFWILGLEGRSQVLKT
jgi:hypothetical protein